jgi:hypothetical protein
MKWLLVEGGASITDRDNGCERTALLSVGTPALLIRFYDESGTFLSFRRNNCMIRPPA